MSNNWLEQQVSEEAKIDLDYKVKIELNRMKITPLKHKERAVSCD